MIKSIIINSYTEFLCAKERGVFNDLKEGDEMCIVWGPLVKLVMISLFKLYDKNGLRPYVLFADDEHLVVSFVEEA